jgi:hypothetical protein
MATAYPGASEQLGPTYRVAIADASQYREIYNYRAQLKLLLKQRVDVVVTDRLLTQWYLPHLEKELGFTKKIRYFSLSGPVFLRFVCRNPGVLEDFMAGSRLSRSMADWIRSGNATYLFLSPILRPVLCKYYPTA